jgi:hypothetical protein
MLAIIDLRVALVAVLCLAASAGLAALTWWFWRNARLESPVLAPLEVMGERRFRRASEDRRQALLDEVRGLVSAPRVAPRTPTMKATVTPVAYDLYDEPLIHESHEEWCEESVERDEPAAPIIDPLLGRRGN